LNELSIKKELGKRNFTDQLGREVTISFPPERIISLVPSQTELLCYLGLSEKVIGITKFCIYPSEKFKSAVKIGGTKNFHFDKIESLHPDLIIGNKEENYQGGIEKLNEQFPVWMSDIATFSHAIEMINSVGAITNKEKEAKQLISEIENRFKKLTLKPIGTVAYFIWRKPYMVAGGGTFINEMLKVAGLVNVFEDQPRYPVVTENMLEEKNPDFILLSSEPYPFKEKHFTEFQSLSNKTKIELVDGEMFSWYGSRLLQAPQYFQELHERLNRIS
jgi:ABC-type Fe3+-hydroxamate transport system substrate-binding protein